MSRPALQGKQPRRSVGFDITAEQYAILLQRQADHTGRISIAMLARQAFDRGLTA